MQSTTPPSPMPVRDSADARFLLSLAIARPLEHETLAFLINDDGVGGQIIAVAPTEPPDAVLDVVDLMVRSASGLPFLRRLVVASIRPDGALLPGDVDRWLEASSIAHRQGLLLVEWYVIGPQGIECPRDLLGEPERWPVQR